MTRNEYKLQEQLLNMTPAELKSLLKMIAELIGPVEDVDVDDENSCLTIRENKDVEELGVPFRFTVPNARAQIKGLFDSFNDDWEYARNKYTGGDNGLNQLFSLSVELHHTACDDLLSTCTLEIGDGRDLADVVGDDPLWELLEDKSIWGLTDQQLIYAHNCGDDEDHFYARVLWTIKSKCPSHSVGCEGYWMTANNYDIDLGVEL